MSDLPSLMNRASSGFTPDPRFLDLPEEAGEPSPMMAVLTGRTARPAPTPAASAPPPDPVATAQAEAYARGLGDGRAEAEAEARARAAALRRFAFAFDRIDAELSELFAQRLTETVVALCEATLTPLALDRRALADRVERAALMYSRADDDRVIRLNPDDLALVAPLLPPEWVFRPDSALERGALRVETTTGGVEDGPAQWARAIREMLDPAAGK